MWEHVANLPESETYGAWSRRDAGDVHIYVNQHYAVVGSYKSYTDKRHPTDLALSLDKEGFNLQYVDKDGNLAHAKLNSDIVEHEIVKLLKTLRDSVEER